MQHSAYCNWNHSFIAGIQTYLELFIIFEFKTYNKMANTKMVHKAKEDDVLECFLYPKICYTTNAEDVSETLLAQEITKFNQEIVNYTNDYIWHNDTLIFRPRTKQAQLLDRILQSSKGLEDRQVIPHIHASLRFDEDIGDEWFTVFLIFRLTQVFDGLIARLIDSDGEFLLIEAANALPQWANPETCQDRVFIYNGAIHVVRDKDKTLFHSLNNIYRSPHFYKMPDQVQIILKKRIGIYPEEIKRRKHKARAFLPEKAASILRQEPGLIAAAIRTICHSDPLERKVCRAMRYFPPEQRTMVNVRMTKCLYAMAMHCRYTGDPRTGWNLPPTNHSTYNAHLLGIKIACGLEMLVAQANEKRRQSMTDEKRMDKVDTLKSNEHTLNTYLERLKSSGYFRDLLDGSQEYEKLLSTAKDYFRQMRMLDNSSDVRRCDAEKVLAGWESIQTNDVEMHEDESVLSPANSDSWLNVDPAQLEMLLNQQWGRCKERKPEQDPLSLREKVQAFLNQSSNIEGVQFLEGQSADDDARHDAEDSGRIEFDADVFDSTLRDILDLVVPGGEGEFEGSSEGSLGGDEEDKGGEMDKYMRLLDSQLQMEMVKEEGPPDAKTNDTVEANLLESMESEAGGSGPTGNIIGGPARRLMHLQLQSPTTVPPDLQS